MTRSKNRCILTCDYTVILTLYWLCGELNNGQVTIGFAVITADSIFS